MSETPHRPGDYAGPVAVTGVRDREVEVVKREFVLHGQRITYLEAGADSGRSPGGRTVTASPADPNRATASRPTMPDGASRLAFDRTGTGEPLILLHGQGFSRRSWDPVIAGLAVDLDVIAVDLPGHGDSPRQPRDRGNTPHDLAIAVAELLDELSIPTAHVAGNSSGGWVALELGRLHRAQTVTALSPAGLWRRRAPRHIRLAMRQARLNARLTRRVAPNAPRSRVARGMAMIQASGARSAFPTSQSGPRSTTWLPRPGSARPCAP